MEDEYFSATSVQRLVYLLEEIFQLQRDLKTVYESSIL